MMCDVRTVFFRTPVVKLVLMVASSLPDSALDIVKTFMCMSVVVRQ